MSKLEIRDPVHGFVQLNEAEIKIVDHPSFQRLRKIKQLALANLLYPGALHTRFDHSTGTRHVAEKMGKALEIEEEELRHLRLAALLHDLGHGPFSHVSENLLSRFAKPEIIEDQGLEEIHELITVQIIKDSDFHSLSSLDQERVIGLLLCEEKDKREQMVNFLKISDCPPTPLLKQIISGPLDADKQDYLLRDSYFCGVKYGVFDIDRLHNTLTTYDDPRLGPNLAISEDGVHTVEQYVMAKYYLNTQVYRHRVRLITDAMITRALELGITQDSLTFLKDLYSYDGSEEFVENYKTWDDERITREILSQGRGKAYEIFEKLIQRKIFKRIYLEKISSFPGPTGDTLTRLNKEKPEKKKQLEYEIAEELGLDPQQTVVNVYKIKSVRVQVKETEGEIKVQNKGAFHEESTLFNSINSAMEDQYVEVYAPAEYTTEEDKRTKQRDWNEKVGNILNSLGGEEL